MKRDRTDGLLNFKDVFLNFISSRVNKTISLKNNLLVHFTCYNTSLSWHDHSMHRGTFFLLYSVPYMHAQTSRQRDKSPLINPIISKSMSQRLPFMLCSWSQVFTYSLHRVCQFCMMCSGVWRLVWYKVRFGRDMLQYTFKECHSDIFKTLFNMKHQQNSYAIFGIIIINLCHH